MKHRDILQQILRAAAGTAVGIALMLLAYALLHRLTVPVLLGALAGGIIAVGNFFFLCMAVSRAIDKAAQTGNAAQAQAEIRGSAAGRLVCVFLLYFVILKFGGLDPIAALLPMIFLQLGLRVIEFFRKDGET